MTTYLLKKESIKFSSNYKKKSLCHLSVLGDYTFSVQKSKNQRTWLMVCRAKTCNFKRNHPPVFQNGCTSIYLQHQGIYFPVPFLLISTHWLSCPNRFEMAVLICPSFMTTMSTKLCLLPCHSSLSTICIILIGFWISLLLCYDSSLYILGHHPLLYISVENIFSQALACFLIFFNRLEVLYMLFFKKKCFQFLV